MLIKKLTFAGIGDLERKKFRVSGFSSTKMTTVNDRFLFDWAAFNIPHDGKHLRSIGSNVDLFSEGSPQLWRILKNRGIEKLAFPKIGALSFR